MREMQRRAAELARAHQRSAIERIAAMINERLQSADAQVRQDAVELMGKGLSKRWITDSELRFLRDFWR